MIPATIPAHIVRPISSWNRVGMTIRWIARETGLDVSDMLDRTRTEPLVRARAAVAWIARRTSDRTLTQIAVALHRTDHTTALQMLAKAEQLRDRDPAFRLMTDRVADRIRMGEQP